MDVFGGPTKLAVRIKFQVVDDTDVRKAQSAVAAEHDTHDIRVLNNPTVVGYDLTVTGQPQPCGERTRGGGGCHAGRNEPSAMEAGRVPSARHNDVGRTHVGSN